MANPFSKIIMATGAAAAVSTGALAMPRPASADTTSTLLTAAAAIGAIVLLNNYEHKQAAANEIVGYTRDGGTVYGDGRIVMPDGQTFYPSAAGQDPNQYVYGSGWVPNYGYVQNEAPPPRYDVRARPVQPRYEAPPQYQAPRRQPLASAQHPQTNSRTQNDQRAQNDQRTQNDQRGVQRDRQH